MVGLVGCFGACAGWLLLCGLCGFGVWVNSLVIVVVKVWGGAFWMDLARAL